MCVCVRVYVYVCAYVNVFMTTCVCVCLKSLEISHRRNAGSVLQAQIDTQSGTLHAEEKVCVCVRARARARFSLSLRLSTHMHARAHTQTHTHAHTRTHTHARKHTYTGLQDCVLVFLRSNGSFLLPGCVCARELVVRCAPLPRPRCCTSKVAYAVCMHVRYTHVDVYVTHTHRAQTACMHACA